MALVSLCDWVQPITTSEHGVRQGTTPVLSLWKCHNESVLIYDLIGGESNNRFKPIAKRNDVKQNLQYLQSTSFHTSSCPLKTALQTQDNSFFFFLLSRLNSPSVENSVGLIQLQISEG